MLKVAISFGLRLWLFHISLRVLKKHTATWPRWPSPFTVPRSVSVGGCIYFHAEGRDGPAETMVATLAWEDSNTYNYNYRPGLMPIIIMIIAQHHRAWSAHHLHPLFRSYLIMIDHPTVNLCIFASFWTSPSSSPLCTETSQSSEVTNGGEGKGRSRSCKSWPWHTKASEMLR